MQHILDNGNIVLIRGDCLQELKNIPPQSIDMVFADLPYGTTRNKWDSIIPLDQLWPRLILCSKITTPYIMTAQSPFNILLGYSNLSMLKYDIVWEKKDITNHLNAKRQPLRKHENILVFYNKPCTYNPQMTYDGKPYKNSTIGYTPNYGAQTKTYRNNNGERYPISIIRTTTSNKNTKHPTEKPVELLEYLIKTYSNAGDIILDPTMGSGTTAVACINTGRRCIGIELDEKYFNIAVERCKEALQKRSNT